MNFGKGQKLQIWRISCRHCALYKLNLPTYLLIILVGFFLGFNLFNFVIIC